MKMYKKRVASTILIILVTLLSGYAELAIVDAQNLEELGVENPWRSHHTKPNGLWRTNVELVFEPGDKSTMTIYDEACTHSLGLSILVKDDTYENYMIAVMTLDDGYTFEDLIGFDFNPLKSMEVYPKDLLESRPPYTRLISLFAVDPDSTSYIGDSVNIDAGELYFTFIVQAEEGEKIIGHHGPLILACDHH